VSAEIRTDLTRKELRNFGLVTAAMLVLFFDILIPWIWDFDPPAWPLAVGLVLVVTGLAIPQALRPVYAIWMRFALVLGWINTRIILGLIFYLIFVPAGLVMRAFGDPMRRGIDSDSASYRVPSNPPKPDPPAGPKPLWWMALGGGLALLGAWIGSLL